jgi:hypothetical protein
MVAAAAPAPVADADTGRTERIQKTGARKVAVPSPEIDASAAPAPAKDPGRVTHHGFESNKETMAAAKSEAKADKPSKAKAARPAPTAASAPAPAPSSYSWILPYAAIGAAFGLVLLGVYYLVERLAH